MTSTFDRDAADIEMPFSILDTDLYKVSAPAGSSCWFEYCFLRLFH